MRVLRSLLPAVLLLALAGCATSFRSQVTRFNALPPTTATFAIAPIEAGNAGSLEFQQYASLVANQLVERGYRPADPGRAELLVELDYGVSTGREVVETRPGFGGYYGLGWGGYGYPGYYGRRWSRYGFYDPFWGPYGGWNWNVPEVYSYTQYDSYLVLAIRRSGSENTLFEGRALADTRSNDLTRLVPNLVQAMFANFPGRSGETVRVSIDSKGRTTVSAPRG